MTISTPVLMSSIKPFSSESSYDFPFIYQTGEQMNKNELEVQRLSDGVVIYNETINTFSLKHPVPSYTMPAGLAYRARVRIGTINSNWSQFSEWVIFWVLDNPNVSITNIDYDNQNRVYNQTVVFTANYIHPNGELLQSYRYNLYDSSKNLKWSYAEHFSDGTVPLTQEVTGLVNGELYYIELKTHSVYQQEFSTGLVPIRPLYESPRLTSTLEVSNIPSEGAVKITANIVQVIGRLYDPYGNEIAKENIEYVDSEKIDMNRMDYHRLVFAEGFEILGNDFIMKLWCQNIPNKKVFAQLKTSYGHIDIVRKDKTIHVYKYVNRVRYPSHYVSSEYNVIGSGQVMIYLKSVHDSIDIEVYTL